MSEHEVLSSNDEVLALRRRVGELETRLETREAQFRRVVELLREDKQSALMKLAGSISHDISNVLVAVLGFSDLLLGKLDTDDPIARSIRMIQDSGNRGVELSRHLLEFSRRRRGENSSFEPDASIGDIMEILPFILPAHSSLSLQPGAEGCHLRFDAGIFQAMVLMGVMNGAAYCREDQNPEITLRTEVLVQKDFSDTTRSVAPGTYCVLHIDSAGHELNAEEVAGLCDPLRVGPNGAEDFGVGYAFAKKALQLVGGDDLGDPVGRRGHPGHDAFPRHQ